MDSLEDCISLLLYLGVAQDTATLSFPLSGECRGLHEEQEPVLPLTAPSLPGHWLRQRHASALVAAAQK